MGMRAVGSSEENIDTDTKRDTCTNLPTPHTHAGRRVWAIRNYMGLGQDGSVIKRMTQQELADELGLSRQTVNRYVNDPIPMVEGWSHRERAVVWSIVVRGDEELLDEYLFLHHLESRIHKQ